MAEADVRIAKEEQPAKALATVGQEDMPVVVRGEATESCFNAAWLESQGCGDATAGPLACACPKPFVQLSTQVVPGEIGWGTAGMLAPDGSDALSHLPEDARPMPCLIACDTPKKSAALVPVHAAVRCALLLPFSADASKVKSVDWIVVRGRDRAAAEAFWRRLDAIDPAGVLSFLKFDQIYDHSPSFPLFLATQKPGDVLVLPPHSLALCSSKLFALVCWERLPIWLLDAAIPPQMPRPPNTHLGKPATLAGVHSCLAAFCALRDLVAPRLRGLEEGAAKGRDVQLTAAEHDELRALVAAVERAREAEARGGAQPDSKTKLADPPAGLCERCGRELFLFFYRQSSSGAYLCPACAHDTPTGALAGSEAPGGAAVAMRSAPVGALPRLLSSAHVLLDQGAAEQPDERRGSATNGSASLNASAAGAAADESRWTETARAGERRPGQEHRGAAASRGPPPPPPFPGQQQQQPLAGRTHDNAQLQAIANKFLAQGAAAGGAGGHGGARHGDGMGGGFGGMGSDMGLGGMAGGMGPGGMGRGPSRGVGPMGAPMGGMLPANMMGAPGLAAGMGGGGLTSLLRSGAGGTLGLAAGLPLPLGGMPALGMGAGMLGDGGRGGGGRGCGGRCGSTGMDKDGQHFDRTRYKTQICRNWKDHGRCNFGPKCNFAHGDIDKMKPYQQVLTDQIETIQNVSQMGAMGQMIPPQLVPPQLFPAHIAGLGLPVGGQMGGMGPGLGGGGMGAAVGDFGAGFHMMGGLQDMGRPQDRQQGGRGADEPRRAQVADPRSLDPRAQAQRADPRAQASADPRRAQAADPRMAGAVDPRQASDPRGAKRDPRTADPRDRPAERERERNYGGY